MSKTEHELIVTVLPLQDEHGDNHYSQERLTQLQLRCMSQLNIRLYAPTAFFELRDHPGSVNVFLTPPMDVDDSIKFRSILQELKFGGWYTQLVKIMTYDRVRKG